MRLAALLFALLTFAHPAAFALTQAVPESDAQKAVRYTAALEADPFAAGANDLRRWLMGWIEQTPDYTVTVCDIYGPITRQDVPYGPELLAQQMFGNVSYQISHPGEHDEVAKQVAGMESLLKAYAAIVARDAKARIPYYDTLLDKQGKGTLKAYLTPIIQQACNKKA